jgi:hypothetical protein
VVVRDGRLYQFDYALDTTGKNVVSTTVTDPSGAKRTVDNDTIGYLIKTGAQ